MKLLDMLEDLSEGILTDFVIDCIDQKFPDYKIEFTFDSWRRNRFTKKKLADLLAQLDPLNEFYRPLSELILQRDLTDTEDMYEAAVEVELELWKHGRKIIKKLEAEK